MEKIMEKFKELNIQDHHFEEKFYKFLEKCDSMNENEMKENICFLLEQMFEVYSHYLDKNTEIGYFCISKNFYCDLAFIYKMLEKLKPLCVNEKDKDLYKQYEEKFGILETKKNMKIFEKISKVTKVGNKTYEVESFSTNCYMLNLDYYSKLIVKISGKKEINKTLGDKFLYINYEKENKDNISQYLNFIPEDYIIAPEKIFCFNNKDHKIAENGANGDLCEVLSEKKEFNKFFAIHRLIKNYETFHFFNCLHIDIKINNIILDKNGLPKLIDFDDSKKFGTIGKNNYYVFNSFGATPEVNSNTIEEKEVTSKSEVYCIGVIIASILSNKTLTVYNFAKSIEKLQLEDINLENFLPPETLGIKEEAEKELKIKLLSLVEHMTAKNLEDRATTLEVEKEYREIINFILENFKKKDGTPLVYEDLLFLIGEDAKYQSLFEIGWYKDEILNEAKNKFVEELESLISFEDIANSVIWDKENGGTKEELAEILKKITTEKETLCLSPTAKKCLKYLKKYIDSNQMPEEFYDLLVSLKNKHEEDENPEFLFVMHKLSSLRELKVASIVNKLEKEKEYLMRRVSENEKRGKTVENELLRDNIEKINNRIIELRKLILEIQTITKMGLNPETAKYLDITEEKLEEYKQREILLQTLEKFFQPCIEYAKSDQVEKFENLINQNFHSPEIREIFLKKLILYLSEYEYISDNIILSLIKNRFISINTKISEEKTLFDIIIEKDYKKLFRYLSAILEGKQKLSQNAVQYRNKLDLIDTLKMYGKIQDDDKNINISSIVDSIICTANEHVKKQNKEELIKNMHLLLEIYFKLDDKEKKELAGKIIYLNVTDWDDLKQSFYGTKYENTPTNTLYIINKKIHESLQHCIEIKSYEGIARNFASAHKHSIKINLENIISILKTKKSKILIQLVYLLVDNVEQKKYHKDIFEDISVDIQSDLVLKGTFINSVLIYLNQFGYQEYLKFLLNRQDIIKLINNEQNYQDYESDLKRLLIPSINSKNLDMVAQIILSLKKEKRILMYNFVKEKINNKEADFTIQKLNGAILDLNSKIKNNYDNTKKNDNSDQNLNNNTKNNNLDDNDKKGTNKDTSKPYCLEKENKSDLKNELKNIIYCLSNYFDNSIENNTTKIAKQNTKTEEEILEDILNEDPYLLNQHLEKEQQDEELKNAAKDINKSFYEGFGMDV